MNMLNAVAAQGNCVSHREAFEDRSLVFPSCESGNAVALAAAGDPIEITFDELKGQGTGTEGSNRSEPAADANGDWRRRRPASTTR